MTDKPAFDPNAPFSTSAPGDKPAFDPNAPFSTSPQNDPFAGYNELAAKRAELPSSDDMPSQFFEGAANKQISSGYDWANNAANAVSQSVGKAASNLPGSAGQLASNIGHTLNPYNWPEIATGLGHLGAGAAQYGAGALGADLGTGYEPEAKASWDALVKRYGGLQNIKDTFETDPAGFLADLSTGLGLIGKLGRVAGPARVLAPTTADVFEAANNGYRNARGYGVEIDRRAVQNLADDIRRELHDDGFRPANHPATFGALDELANPVGPTATIADIDSARKVLNRAGAKFEESASSRRAIEAIDNYTENIPQADVVNNAHYAQAVGQEIAQARANYAAASKARDIEAANNRAELQAASTGSGANINNALRQRYRAILTSRNASRGLSPELRASMEDVVRGNAGDNAMRWLGKAAPSGIVSGAGSMFLGEALGHKYAPIVAGAVTKAIGDLRTASKARRLSEQARLESPLARQMGATPAPRLRPVRTAGSLARKLNLLGRLPEQE